MSTIKLLATLLVVFCATDAAVWPKMKFQLRDTSVGAQLKEALLWPRARMQRRDMTECHTLLDACTSELQQYEPYFQDYDSVTENLFQDEVLDQLCEDLHDFNDCAEDAMDSHCTQPEYTRSLIAAGEVIHYVCSDIGRATIREMSQSACASNESLAMTVSGEFQECASPFYMELFMHQVSDDPTADTTQLCLLADQYGSCAVNVTTEQCGDAFGSFAEELLYIVVPATMGDVVCPQDLIPLRRR